MGRTSRHALHRLGDHGINARIVAAWAGAILAKRGVPDMVDVATALGILQ